MYTLCIYKGAHTKWLWEILYCVKEDNSNKWATRIILQILFTEKNKTYLLSNVNII